jgi:hypothetical protein
MSRGAGETRLNAEILEEFCDSVSDGAGADPGLDDDALQDIVFKSQQQFAMPVKQANSNSELPPDNPTAEPALFCANT